MKQEGLTLKEASEIAGVSISTIQEWKTSSESPADIHAAKRLANQLGVSLAYLLTGETDTIEEHSVSEVFTDGGTLFDGFAQISIKRLVPRKKKEPAE